MPPISAEERPVSTTGRSVSNIGLSFGLELVLRCHLVGGLLERLRGLQEISGGKNIVLLPCSAVGGQSAPPCPPGGAAPGPRDTMQLHIAALLAEMRDMP